MFEKGITVFRLLGIPVGIDPSWVLLAGLVIWSLATRVFPAGDGVLLGSVGTREIKQVPRREWPARTAGEILVPCRPDTMIAPEESALGALTAMSRGGMGRLLVVDHGRLAGIVTLADLFRLVAVKLDLEVADPAPRKDRPPPLPVFWSGRPAGR